MSARARRYRAIGRAAAAAALLLIAAARAAGAQDFSAAAPAGPGGVAAALESALPRAAPGAALELVAARRFGLPELGGGAVACGASWRAVRVAFGAAQAGDPGLGWRALGAAAGVVGPDHGLALRAVARRDASPAAGDGAVAGAAAGEPGSGIEAGLGAWLAPRAGVRLWLSAPQTWTAGAAPPLARGIETGIEARAPGLAGWLAHRATRGPGGHAGTHVAGLALETGPGRVWLEGLDAPPRAALGVEASAGGLGVAARIEGHPVLGESAWLALRFGAGR